MLVPVVVVLGEFGTGKTLYATYKALKFSERNPGKTVFANYPIKGIKNFREYHISELSEGDFPEWLHDGLLIMDEIQIGADAYDFMRSGTRNIVAFITQIRKLNLELIMVTPVYTFIAKRLRDIANFMITLKDMVVPGFVTANYYRLLKMGSKTFKAVYLRTMKYDLNEVFPYYDTKYIVKSKRRETNETER